MNLEHKRILDDQTAQARSTMVRTGRSGNWETSRRFVDSSNGCCCCCCVWVSEVTRAGRRRFFWTIIKTPSTWRIQLRTHGAQRHLGQSCILSWSSDPMVDSSWWFVSFVTTRYVAQQLGIRRGWERQLNFVRNWIKRSLNPIAVVFWGSGERGQSR